PAVLHKGAIVTRLQADSDLRPQQFGSVDAYRQFLIDQAVRNYSYIFGQTIYPYYYGGPIFATSGSLELEGQAALLTTTAGVATTVAGDTTFSKTNVQVAGVDEADIVKTDGRYLYVLANDKLSILAAWPAADLQSLSVTALEGGAVGEFLD